MKSVFSIRNTVLTIVMSALLIGCGGSEEMSQEEIEYLSHIDQARFFQRQGELKASTIEARSAIELQPERPEPYLVIINNLLTAGDARNAERQLDQLMQTIDLADISQQSLNNAALIRAEANLMQEDFEGSLEALSRINEPDRAQQTEAALLRGDILLASENYESAREAYENAKGLAPSSVEPLVGLSKVAFREGNLERTSDLIQQAKEIDPQSAELALWMARLAHNEGRWEEAEQAYVTALETIGQYDVMTYRKFETMSALIDVLRQQGKASEAFVYEEILAKSAPGTIRSNLLAAEEAFNEGDLTAAARYLEETLNQAPNHERAALMLGLIRYRQGRPEEAEKLLEPVAALQESEQAQKLLAATRLQLRNPEGAKDVLSGLEDQSSDPGTLALVGIATLATGDKESGEQMIERALELSPDNTNLRLRYATYLIREGKTEQALNMANIAIENDPSLDQAYLTAIQAHVSANNLDKARQTVNRWLMEQPNNPSAIIAAGTLAARSGNPTEAETYFDRAAKAAPENAMPLVHLGNLARSQGKPDAAKSYFIKAVELQPDNQQALRGLSIVIDRAELTALMEQIHQEQPNAIGPRLVMLESALINGEQGKADELTANLLARESENEPSAASPLVAAVYNGIASILAQRDRHVDAMNILQRGRVLFPDNEEIGLQAAALSFSREDTKTAREILSDIKQRHPDSSGAFLVEARHLEQAQEFTQAADLYQLALEKQSSVNTEISYVRSLIRAGQINKAIESLQAAKERFPGSEPLLSMLAIQQQQKGDIEPAEETYVELLKVSPNNVVALNNLAWLYHEQNDERAIQLGQKAYELSENNAAVADTYGWILFKAGMVEESLPILKKAHEIQPDSEEIAMHLVEVYRSLGREGEAKTLLEKINGQAE